MFTKYTGQHQYAGVPQGDTADDCVPALEYIEVHIDIR